MAQIINTQPGLGGGQLDNQQLPTGTLLNQSGIGYDESKDDSLPAG